MKFELWVAKSNTGERKVVIKADNERTETEFIVALTKGEARELAKMLEFHAEEAECG